MEKLSYYKPIYLEDGSVLSCDMVRLKLKFEHEMAQHFGDKLNSNFRFADVEYHEQIWGLYRHLWNPKFEDGSSFAVGMGLQQKGRSPKWDVGYLEFNPNKVNCSNGVFREFWLLLQMCCRRAELVRWDMAQDFPVDRNFLMFRKSGQATYRYELWGSATEYIGRHNAPGFCKLYDKQAESGLIEPLTRVEMTCAGDWDALEICEHRPKLVGRVLDNDLSDCKGQTIQLVQALSILQGNEIPIEHILGGLPARKKKEVETLLRGSPPDLYPFEAVRSLVADVKEDWTFGCFNFANDTTVEPDNDTWNALMGLTN